MKKLKYIAIPLVAAVGIFAFMHLPTKTIEVTNETKTEVVEVEVDPLEEAIASALAASSTEIEEKARKAYEGAKRQAEVEIELQVRSQYLEEQEVKVKELQKESVAY